MRWRKRWDSNPRALADNRISSAARCDHFDTLPRKQRMHYSMAGCLLASVTRTIAEEASGIASQHRPPAWSWPAVCASAIRGAALVQIYLVIVTVTVAFFPVPSMAAAVITALPAARKVTRPFSSTVAIFVLLLLQAIP